MMSDASEMLAAALEQMDGIIAGSKAMDYSNGLFDCQSPTSPFLGGMRALHLLEDLRGALEVMDGEERVSVLTDQVEVQGEKIRDLDTCLAEHQEKLNNTEQLFQQELSNRTTLETQKTELMTEVSSLKAKLAEVERDCKDAEGLQQEVMELRFRVNAVENERLQCAYQVEVQGEKIRDLDTCLAEHQEKLNNTEQLFQQELSNRTTLETQKTELMTEVSSLKAKLAEVERDCKDA
ncbi:hypothetical protein CRUP_013795, partial [Coryphaenoides rupestris]